LPTANYGSLNSIDATGQHFAGKERDTGSGLVFSGSDTMPAQVERFLYQERGHFSDRKQT